MRAYLANRALTCAGLGPWSLSPGVPLVTPARSKRPVSSICVYAFYANLCSSPSFVPNYSKLQPTSSFASAVQAYLTTKGRIMKTAS